MRSVPHSRFWAVAAALALASPSVAHAQEFSVDDPAYAHLYPHEDAAEQLVENGPQDGPGKRAIIAAFDELHAAAGATRLPDGSAHPLAALADIKIASQLYALGENLAAIERGARGTSATRPSTPRCRTPSVRAARSSPGRTSSSRCRRS